MTFMLWFYWLNMDIPSMSLLNTTTQIIDWGLIELFNHWTDRKKDYYNSIC